jgi:uncharacterized protein
MTAYQPDKCYNKVSDIPFSLLENWRIKAILLDKDNTIASRGSVDYLPSALEWIRDAIDAGFKLALISNGLPWKVKNACRRIGIPYVVPAPIGKPFPFGFRMGARRLGADASECVMIGDQLFTDIQGAKRAGMKAILVNPINPDSDMPWTRFIRRLTSRDSR